MRKLFNYEKRHQPLASRDVFYNRLSLNALWALATVTVSLAIGSAGYAFFEGMTLLDAFTNAAMILSGMGPFGPLHTAGGKLFASFYAIASGLLLFAIAGLLLAPIYHRILHRFHVDESDDRMTR
jgi:TRAP-type C4-dicarboxylate transport system permease small subunit